MLMISKSLNIILSVAAVLFLASCQNLMKKKGTGGGAGADGDYVSGTPLSEREEGVSFLSPNVDRKQFSPVHFAFDSYSIEPNDEPKLAQVAEFLQNNRSTIIVAGFTDERGTPEYNRGLGERRAQSVREYLIRRGADARKIQTVSFGAEMPVDASSNESAWAKNRRAEFGVVR